jgi:3-hydroxyacyl-CoA dehydrogenase
MGSAIAAHFANIGIPALVLDVVPSALTEAERSAALSLRERAVRDRIARNGVAALARITPPPLYHPDRLRLIATGNLEDDLPRLREVDWVIEAVKEDLAIKQQVLAAAAPHLGPAAVIATNSSGLSLATMAGALPEATRPRFLGLHFFNPPRYMKLLEVTPAVGTDPDVLAAVCDFGRRRLGKGIVVAKDTPNFIANRIGAHAMMATLRVMAAMGLTVEEIDALTGPAIGRPRTATFRLADLVGLDTFLHVIDNVRAQSADDESRELFRAPDFLRRMVERGLLGRKSSAGFYKKVKVGADEAVGEGAPGSDKAGTATARTDTDVAPAPRDEILTLNLETLEYRAALPARLLELEEAAAITDPGERLRAVVLGRGRTAEAVWRMLAPTFTYAAQRVGEICDDAAAIDRAMRWGYNWELGPFEAWDALGFRAVTERLRAEERPLPGWVDALYDAGAPSLYADQDGDRLAPTANPGRRVSVPADPRMFDFARLRRAGREVRRNPGASLLDLGDGVLGLEFHSKLNVLGQDSIAMTMAAVDEAEARWQALVVANQGENFSAGANLMLLLQEALEGNWDEIDAIVRAFQGATDRLEQCGVPVVVAPHGLALGGGCEITMAGNAVHAAAEAYVGLVEFGAGLIPAGGGCLRLWLRHVALLPDPADLYPALRRTFETIGMAKVGASAEESRALGYLRPQDGWSVNGEHRIAAAKELALALARAGYAPPPAPAAVPVMGRSGIALLETILYNLREARSISDHDRKIGGALARVLCGGDLPGPTSVSGRHILDLEREEFLRLCGERKTLERMQALLKTGKPLRN